MLSTWLLRILTAIGATILVRKSTEDKSTKPKVTWIGWLLNVMLAPMFIYQPSDAFKPLNLDILKENAMNVSGLNDFGDWDERPYRETINVINNNKDYSPLGRYLVYSSFVNRLVVTLEIQNTLKINKSLKEYSQQNKIKRPCFVLGMPRTGTTFLHQLLSLDPNVRAPKTYELDYPVPQIPDDLEKDKEARIKQSEFLISRVKFLAPHLLQSHEMSPTAYEQCSHVLVNDVPIDPKAFMFKNKETFDLVLNWNWEKVYQNYYKVLQMLEYYHLKSNPEELDTKRWVLKCPIHLGFLSDLLEVFPDADIIWCHRDIAENILSIGTLFRAAADIYLKKVLLNQIGKTYFEQANTLFSRANVTLQNNSNVSCTNVKYNEFMKDPIQMIKKIYDNLGYEFTDEYHTILETYIKEDTIKRENLRKNDSRIPVTLESFGTSYGQIDEELSWYKEKYL